MIIDLILDRKDGAPYSPRKFYCNCLEYGEIGHDITLVMDYGTEANVRQVLCNYITGNNYPDELCDFIRSLNWL